MTCLGCDPHELLAMEEEIRGRCDLSRLSPTINEFAKSLWERGSLNRNVICHIKYLADRAIQEKDLLEYKPSVIAASAVFLALKSAARTDPVWVRCAYATVHRRQ